MDNSLELIVGENTENDLLDHGEAAAALLEKQVLKVGNKAKLYCRLSLLVDSGLTTRMRLADIHDEKGHPLEEISC